MSTESKLPKSMRDANEEQSRRRRLQAFQGGLIHPILGYVLFDHNRSSKYVVGITVHKEDNNSFKSLHV